LAHASVTLRPIAPDDHGPCAHLLYEAFRAIGERHGFPPVFGSVADAAKTLDLFSRVPIIRAIVAERDGRPVGVVYLDERDPIRAIALIGVDPAAQERGVGRRLMDAALAHVGDARGVRLVQEAHNRVAMALYASLGFEVKEPLVRIAGTPAPVAERGKVRPLQIADLEQCGRLTQRVHGIDRNADLRDGIEVFKAFGLERDGRITAFTYTVFGGGLAWGVGETDEDLRELLSGVSATLGAPIAFALPTRQAGLFRWCLSEDFRIEKPLTLMARGEYHEPRGAWFPSGFY
jgi:GNAT superfamily N-acetyltransferase